MKFMASVGMKNKTEYSCSRKDIDRFLSVILSQKWLIDVSRWVVKRTRRRRSFLSFFIDFIIGYVIIIFWLVHFSFSFSRERKEREREHTLEILNR
jgi:hypothetical protein